MSIRKSLTLLCALAFACEAGAAWAVTNFTETFNTNASGWLAGTNSAPTYNATGGVGDSGYISYTSTFTSGASGPMGSPALQILMRGNNAANASGDAFVGNWITSGIDSLSVSIRHNYTTPLTFYARLNASAGAAASSAPSPSYTVAPNTWTKVTLPIANSNPPFLSYGAGTFNSVFSNINDLQIGLYVPPTTNFTNLKFDLDNVSVSIPEPASFGLVSLALGSLLTLRPRRSSAN